MHHSRHRLLNDAKNSLILQFPLIFFTRFEPTKALSNTPSHPHRELSQRHTMSLIPHPPSSREPEEADDQSTTVPLLNNLSSTKDQSNHHDHHHHHQITYDDHDRGNNAWTESKKLWRIVGPAIFFRATNFSMITITQAFAGHLGDLELAAISLAYNVIIGFDFGLLVRQIQKPILLFFFLDFFLFIFYFHS